MCVYNHTNGWQNVYLDCGTCCHNHWDHLESGSHACRPGKGGKVSVYFSAQNDALNCKVEVDKHGWVSLSEKNYGAITRYIAKSKHSNGSTKQTCHVDQ